MTTEVTQEDAELVAFIIEEWGLMSGTTIGHIRRGLYNDDRIVKAAARHRLAALNARQSGEGERDSAIDEIQSLRKRVERLEGALREIVDRSHNDPLGTSKVIDMRKIAVAALSPKVQGEE